MKRLEVDSGLEHVVVAQTALSEVDGERGRLVIAGHSIEQLAGHVEFEDVVCLLLDGCLPDAERRNLLRVELGRERVRARERLRSVETPLLESDPMGFVRSALSLVPAGTGVAGLLATAALATALSNPLRKGALLEPNPELGHAHDFLRLLLGREVNSVEVALFEAYLVTVAEHGFNASTFATRVVASTGADLASAVVAGVAALSGPLHGGAPGPVLDLLDKVGEPSRAAAVIREELERGRRLMGMGHRVYHVRDPRAAVLERAIRTFERTSTSARLELARAVEAAAETELARRYPTRPLKANVEFYTAVLLDTLGISRDSFTAIFACARIAGYAAHTLEQRAKGRLIRPSATYVGPPEAKSYPSRNAVSFVPLGS
jgi:citrate synthase